MPHFFRWIVKSVASHAGRFSSHSLQIGGATAAVEAGMDLVEVFIGGLSQAMQHYLRSMGAITAKDSARMGL